MPTLLISGDTGWAVISGLAGCKEVTELVLYIKGVVVAIALLFTIAL